MPLSEKAMQHKREYNIKYKKEKCRRVSLEMPFEMYDEMKTISQDLNESVNGFIKKSIDERIKQIKERS